MTNPDFPTESSSNNRVPSTSTAPSSRRGRDPTSSVSPPFLRVETTELTSTQSKYLSTKISTRSGHDSTIDDGESDGASPFSSVGPSAELKPAGDEDELDLPRSSQESKPVDDDGALQGSATVLGVTAQGAVAQPHLEEEVAHAVDGNEPPLQSTVGTTQERPPRPPPPHTQELSLMRKRLRRAKDWVRKGVLRAARKLRIKSNIKETKVRAAQAH